MSFLNEQAALQNYHRQQAENNRAPGLMMDFGRHDGKLEDVSRYMNMKYPGTECYAMRSNAMCLFPVDARVAKEKQGYTWQHYLWRAANDPWTKRQVAKRNIRPVLVSEVDKNSEHAVFYEYAMHTEEGIRSVVSWNNLCCYEMTLEAHQEWFQSVTDRYKGDLAHMKYNISSQLRKQGFESPREANGMMMSEFNTRRENPLG
jgi:hypothetical protein